MAALGGIRMGRLVRAPVDLARRSVSLFFAIDGFDRSMALAAQAFTTLFPLLIVIAAVFEGSHGSSLGDALVKEFDLSGAAADSVRRAFPAASTVTGSVTLLSALILLISALSFTRALQRVYERTWGLEPRGVRDAAYGLAWLACFALYISLHPVLHGHLSGALGLALSISGSFVLWLVTPCLIVARRLPWQTFVVQALLTAIALTVLRAASAIYMPRAISASSQQFGAIGLAFALVGWLFATGVAVVACAAIGAALATRGAAAADGPR